VRFLAEAVFGAGIAGSVIGIASSRIVATVSGWPGPISRTAVAGGFLFSAAVGIVFGYFPAREAASLNPIEALRYE